MATLDVKTLTVSLSGRDIVRQISFEARAGEVTAIAGPNGSGKSTLLKAICGEYRHGGDVHLNGHDLRRVPAHVLARFRAVLPQSSAIAFPLTVTELVRLGGAGMPPPDSRVREALARVGLNGFGGRQYQSLSGGEQQRAQLARVLCQIWEPVGPEGPRWLFLDEPVASLDIHHQLMIMDLAADYAKAGGGVVAVMHDLNLTAMYAARVLALKAGQVIACGTTAETLTTEVLSEVYSCPLRVGAVPPPGTPFILPHLCHARLHAAE